MKEVCGACGRHHRIITTDECRDRAMSEKTLQSRVVGRAKRQGWKVAHAGRAFMPGDGDAAGFWLTPMSVGWPDLTLAKAGHRLLFIELKKEQGEIDDYQLEWLGLLNQCGARAIVIRPSHLRDGTVKAVLTEGSPLEAP